MQPTPYERKYDLTNDDGQDLRTQLDIELDDVARCFLETLTNLALIQRDDGQLANKSVGVEQLKAELIAGFNPPEPFQPFRLYEVSDSFVTDDGKWYIVNTAFTATADPADNTNDITLVYDFAAVRVDTIAAKDAAEAAQTAAELARDQAQSAATSASNDAVQTGQDRQAAANSASSAASSASSASNSADASAASASNAANAEQAAEAAEAKAELWADEDENVEVETGRYSARHWAQKAAELGGDPNQYQVTTSTGTQTLVDALDDRLVATDLNIRVLSSLTSMQAQTGSASIYYILKGRVALNDGGEGFFAWDAGDLSAEVASDEVTLGEGDGGVYIAPASDKTGASGAWIRQKVINVYPEWYRAVGDGVANDTLAVILANKRAAALRVGLHFRPKTYLIDGIRFVNNEYVPAYVEGNNCKLIGAAAGPLMFIENPHGEFDNWYCQNFYLDGNLTANVGLNLHGMQHGTLKNIFATRCLSRGFRFQHEAAYGIYYNVFEKLVADRNEGWGCEVEAVDATNRCNANNWIKCTFNFNKGNGFRGARCKDDFFGCGGEKNDLFAFRFEETNSVGFFGGYTEGNDQNWATDGASDGSEDRGFFTDSTVSGFKLIGGRHIGVFSGIHPAEGTIIAPTDQPTKFYSARGLFGGRVTIGGTSQATLVAAAAVPSNCLAIVSVKPLGSNDHQVASVSKAGAGGALLISSISRTGGTNVNLVNVSDGIVLENNTGSSRDIEWTMEIKYTG